jgi:hypothetical protein
MFLLLDEVLAPKVPGFKLQVPGEKRRRRYPLTWNLEHGTWNFRYFSSASTTTVAVQSAICNLQSAIERLPPLPRRARKALTRKALT